VRDAASFSPMSGVKVSSQTVARFLAIAEAIVGQLYVAVLVARLVGIRSPGQAGEATPG